MKDEQMFNVFLEVSKKINEKFSIQPILYGSFGLKRLLGVDYVCDDIDVLVPNELITTRWPDFERLLI
jgi:hypothetical protein